MRSATSAAASMCFGVSCTRREVSVLRQPAVLADVVGLVEVCRRDHIGKLAARIGEHDRCAPSPPRGRNPANAMCAVIALRMASWHADIASGRSSSARSRAERTWLRALLIRSRPRPCSASPARCPGWQVLPGATSCRERSRAVHRDRHQGLALELGDEGIRRRRRPLRSGEDDGVDLDAECVLDRVAGAAHLAEVGVADDEEIDVSGRRPRLAS